MNSEECHERSDSEWVSAVEVGGIVGSLAGRVKNAKANDV